MHPIARALAELLGLDPATTGRPGQIHTDLYGRLHVTESGGTPAAPSASNYSATLYANRGAATNAQVKATAGNVFAASVINLSAAPIYLQLHNVAGGVTASRAVGADGLSFLVPANGTLLLGRDVLSELGFYFATAISVGLSSVPGIFTAVTAADAHTQVWYK
jgi:hypothetical protein